MSTVTETSIASITNKATNAKNVLAKAEAEIVAAVIKATRYNQSRAAIALGVSRGTMRKLLETHYPGEYVGSVSPSTSKGRSNR